MFFPLPRNESFVAQHCLAAWNVTVTEQSKGWMATSFDFPRMRGASNIVFSRCGFDGWGSAGLDSPDPARMLVAIDVAEAAHHADFMFSTPDDPPSFAVARAEELGFVAAFISQAREASAAARREL